MCRLSEKAHHNVEERVCHIILLHNINIYFSLIFLIPASDGEAEVDQGNSENSDNDLSDDGEAKSDQSSKQTSDAEDLSDGGSDEEGKDGSNSDKRQ